MSARGDTYFTIVNPAAGGGRCAKRAEAAIARLRASGLTLEVRETGAAGEASERAQKAWAEGYRRFLSIGGDGTTFEVVNGLFPLALETPNERPHLALLPLGTGNSFLRDFGIESPEQALSAIEARASRRCDVVRATHRAGELFYINLLSVGFSAEAGALTNRRFKPLGAAGYIAAVLITAARLSHPVFAYRVDGGPLDARPSVLLSFSNSRYTGGTMMMAPAADPTDGELDVIHIGALGRLAFIGAFPKIFAGTHVELPDVETGRAREVTFELDSEVDAMVDGEIRRLALERLEVLPGALEVAA